MARLTGKVALIVGGGAEIYSRQLLTMPSDPNQARLRSREGA